MSSTSAVHYVWHGLYNSHQFVDYWALPEPDLSMRGNVIKTKEAEIDGLPEGFKFPFTLKDVAQRNGVMARVIAVTAFRSSQVLLDDLGVVKIFSFPRDSTAERLDCMSPNSRA